MPHQRKQFTLQKYILTFLITAMIFGLGFFLSDYLNDRRFLEIDRARRDFQIQILDMEAQLDHFEEILCPDIGDDILSHELHIIGEMLQFMANNLGREHPEVLYLKKYYSFLQIRHYRLSQRLCQRCDLGLVHIIYFFADEEYCPDCEKQGVILTSLRRRYPKLRIYSFDYHLDLLAIAAIRPLRPEPVIKIDTKSKLEISAEPNVKSLIQEYDLPVIIIEGKPFWGFRDLEEMENILAPKFLD